MGVNGVSLLGVSNGLVSLSLVGVGSWFNLLVL